MPENREAVCVDNMGFYHPTETIHRANDLTWESP